MDSGKYAFYKSQISETVDGKKKVLDKSWLNRGTLVIVTGYRRENDFVCKKYSRTIFQHSMSKIDKVYDDGSIDIISERYGIKKDEEEN